MYEIDELNDPYSSPNIIPMIISRTVRLGRSVACMGEKRGAYRVLVEKPDGKRRLGTARPDGITILNLIFKMFDRVMDCTDVPQDRDR